MVRIGFLHGKSTPLSREEKQEQKAKEEREAAHLRHRQHLLETFFIWRTETPDLTEEISKIAGPKQERFNVLDHDRLFMSMALTDLSRAEQLRLFGQELAAIRPEKKLDLDTKKKLVDYLEKKYPEWEYAPDRGLTPDVNFLVELLVEQGWQLETAITLAHFGAVEVVPADELDGLIQDYKTNLVKREKNQGGTILSWMRRHKKSIATLTGLAFTPLAIGGAPVYKVTHETKKSGMIISKDGISLQNSPDAYSRDYQAKGFGEKLAKDPQVLKKIDDLTKDKATSITKIVIKGKASSETLQGKAANDQLKQLRAEAAKTEVVKLLSAKGLTVDPQKIKIEIDHSEEYDGENANPATIAELEKISHQLGYNGDYQKMMHDYEHGNHGKKWLPLQQILDTQRGVDIQLTLQTPFQTGDKTEYTTTILPIPYIEQKQLVVDAEKYPAAESPQYKLAEEDLLKDIDGNLVFYKALLVSIVGYNKLPEDELVDRLTVEILRAWNQNDLTAKLLEKFQYMTETHLHADRHNITKDNLVQLFANQAVTEETDRIVEQATADDHFARPAQRAYARQHAEYIVKHLYRFR